MRDARGEGVREKERERVGEMVSGACTAASSNRNPWRRSSRSATYPCTSIRRFCAAHLRLSGLSRRCPSRATACGCGLTAPIGMARIGYWRSSNGIEQGSGGKAGRVIRGSGFSKYRERRTHARGARERQVCAIRG